MFGKALEKLSHDNDFFKDIFSQVKAGNAIGAVALTEEYGGSDSKNFRSKLVEISKNCYELSGKKVWITLGGVANYYIVAAQLDGSVKLALIPAESKGLTFENMTGLIGNRGSAIAEINFESVKVQKFQILPETLIDGWPCSDWILSVGRVMAASSAIGLSKECLSDSFSR